MYRTTILTGVVTEVLDKQEVEGLKTSDTQCQKFLNTFPLVRFS